MLASENCEISLFSAPLTIVIQVFRQSSSVLHEDFYYYNFHSTFIESEKASDELLKLSKLENRTFRVAVTKRVSCFEFNFKNWYQAEESRQQTADLYTCFRRFATLMSP